MKTDSVVEFIESVGGLFTLEGNVLRSVDLSGLSITDDDLAILEDQIAIDHLTLSKTAVTDEGISKLGSLVDLECLYLKDTNITGRCLVNLRCNSLKRLSLSRCMQLNGANLAHLKGFRSLERLWLDGTSIDDEALIYLGNMRSLEFIWLANTRVSDEGMRYLANIRSLRSIDVMGTAVTEKGLQLLRESIPNFRPGIIL